jgi:hypothetical protein
MAHWPRDRVDLAALTLNLQWAVRCETLRQRSLLGLKAKK